MRNALSRLAQYIANRNTKCCRYDFRLWGMNLYITYCDKHREEFINLSQQDKGEE